MDWMETPQALPFSGTPTEFLLGDYKLTEGRGEILTVEKGKLYEIVEYTLESPEGLFAISYGGFVFRGV